VSQGWSWGGISGRSLTIEAHPEHEAAHSTCQQPFAVFAKKSQAGIGAQKGKAKHPIGARSRMRAREKKGCRVSIKKLAKKDTTGRGNHNPRLWARKI
jgi:hypothetical protein